MAAADKKVGPTKREMGKWGRNAGKWWAKPTLPS
jgi:hypothetical protein